jgi:hypothetical protein
MVQDTAQAIQEEEEEEEEQVKDKWLLNKVKILKFM